MTFEVMTHVEKFDLTNFPNGMEITLTEQPGGGKYKFTATNQVIASEKYFWTKATLYTFQNIAVNISCFV